MEMRLEVPRSSQEFQRVEKFNYKRTFQGLRWPKRQRLRDNSLRGGYMETIEKGKKKFNVPDEVKETRDAHLFDKIKGNPFKIAITKVAGEIDMQELLSE